MPRAYIRLDPDLRRRKRDYPDGAFRAFIEALCAAEGQAMRGRFESRAVLRALLGARSRWIPYLIDHGDLVEEASGELDVDGWDIWQEGDLPPAARVAQVRQRRGEGDVSASALRMRRWRERHNVTGGAVTAEPPVTRNSNSTSDASSDASHNTRDARAAVGGKRLAGSGDRSGGSDARLNGGPREMSDDERRATISASVAASQVILDDPTSSEAAKKAAAHGVETGTARLAALDASQDLQQATAEEPAAPDEVSFDAP